MKKTTINGVTVHKMFSLTEEKRCFINHAYQRLPANYDLFIPEGLVAYYKALDASITGIGIPRSLYAKFFEAPAPLEVNFFLGDVE